MMSSFPNFGGGQLQQRFGQLGQGQLGQFGGSFGSFNLLSKLRRTYLVIVGTEAPQPEKDNAEAIAASHMMQKLNFSRVVTSDDSRLDQTSKFANIIVVGGPISNEWAFKLNDFCNPRWDITVVKERTAGQTWKDYVAGGGLSFNGFLVNEAKVAGTLHKGFIGSGKNTSYPRLRPLQITLLGGWTFEDTCCVVKAFLEDQAAGLYNTIWATADPTFSKCPVDGNYSINQAV